MSTVVVKWRRLDGDAWQTTTHDVASFKAGSTRLNITERLFTQARVSIDLDDAWEPQGMDEAVETIWADCNCRAGARAAAERDARRQTRKARIRAHARHKNG